MLVAIPKRTTKWSRRKCLWMLILPLATINANGVDRHVEEDFQNRLVMVIGNERDGVRTSKPVNDCMDVTRINELLLFIFLRCFHKILS